MSHRTNPESLSEPRTSCKASIWFLDPWKKKCSSDRLPLEPTGEKNIFLSNGSKRPAVGHSWRPLSAGAEYLEPWISFFGGLEGSGGGEGSPIPFISSSRKKTWNHPWTFLESPPSSPMRIFDNFRNSPSHARTPGLVGVGRGATQIYSLAGVQPLNHNKQQFVKCLPTPGNQQPRHARTPQILASAPCSRS